MNILFVHQNFPGQFKHLAPELVKQGHNVFAFSLTPSPSLWNGVKVIVYKTDRGSTPNIHPWLTDFETKLIRGEACYKAALELRDSGFTPNVIIAHHGWGESLFLKDIWPSAKLGIYCEFFYHYDGTDVGFDPEFNSSDLSSAPRIRIKNINNFLNFEIADAGISPTYWQANTFPASFRPKITVIHDGIDTNLVAPSRESTITLGNSLKLSSSDEIITFVNRNLEPYRGYHIFMRALPRLLVERPNAHILIVGGNKVSYGSPHPSGQSWKDLLVSEIKPKIRQSDWSRVHFLGNIEYRHFVPLLQLSSVHVYLTYPFVLSWSLLESMSAGCAIVASNTPPLHEAIFHNKTGLLCDFFNPDDLVDKILVYLNNSKIAEKCASNAREFAVLNYDLKSICLPKQLDWVDQLASS